MISILIRIGLVRRKGSGSIKWPFSVPALWMFKEWRGFVGYLRYYGWRPYLFRNSPHVQKWIPGRLLPRRWGIGWLGFEFGDRG